MTDMNRIKDAIIRMDCYHTCLGVELSPALNDGYFDPDRFFTQIERQLNDLIDNLGFDMDEIRRESNEMVKYELHRFDRAVDYEDDSEEEDE